LETQITSSFFEQTRERDPTEDLDWNLLLCGTDGSRNNPEKSHGSNGKYSLRVTQKQDVKEKDYLL